MTTVTCKCKNCGAPFQAREADRKRGWARFCSKSCKAIKQTRTFSAQGRRPTRDGVPITDGGLTDAEIDAGKDCMEAGWDGHKA